MVSKPCGVLPFKSMSPHKPARNNSHLLFKREAQVAFCGFYQAGFDGWAYLLLMDYGASLFVYSGGARRLFSPRRGAPELISNLLLILKLADDKLGPLTGESTAFTFSLPSPNGAVSLKS